MNEKVLDQKDVNIDQVPIDKGQEVNMNDKSVDERNFIFKRRKPQQMMVFDVEEGS